MKTNKSRWGKLFPVFFSFIVMGFVDIIGVATGYIKKDFELTNFVVQFLPMMVLLWFFVLSVPAGVLQDKYGKRNMLNIGMVLQAIGLGLPFLSYSFGMMFASFILLGIGNTIIQVSANPLLQDVSPSEKLASYLITIVPGSYAIFALFRLNYIVKTQYQVQCKKVNQFMLKVIASNFGILAHLGLAVSQFFDSGFETCLTLLINK